MVGRACSLKSEDLQGIKCVEDAAFGTSYIYPGHPGFADWLLHEARKTPLHFSTRVAWMRTKNL
jgi:hypothetical protein